MTVLVTRPSPDDEATSSSLRARGYDVLLAPMLRFEAVAFHEDMDALYGAVIVTSANAVRGIEPHLKGHRLLDRPPFAAAEIKSATAAHAQLAAPDSLRCDAAGVVA